MTPEQKRSNWNRLAPKRVEVIRDKLRILGNCSNKGSYRWDGEIAQRLFALLFLEFIGCAACFGIRVEAQVDGQDVRAYLEPDDLVA